MTRRNESDSLLIGILLVFGCHILALLAYLSLLVLIAGIAASLSYPAFLSPIVSNYYGLIPLFFFGLAQLIYVVPLALRMRRRSKTEMMKGVIIAATFTFLLNSACFIVPIIANNLSR
jgi:hypothetical protein